MYLLISTSVSPSLAAASGKTNTAVRLLWVPHLDRSIHTLPLCHLGYLSVSAGLPVSVSRVTCQCQLGYLSVSAGLPVSVSWVTCQC